MPGCQPSRKKPEPSQSDVLAKRITAVGTMKNDRAVDKFYYKLGKWK